MLRMNIFVPHRALHTTIAIIQCRPLWAAFSAQLCCTELRTSSVAPLIEAIVHTVVWESCKKIVMMMDPYNFTHNAKLRWLITVVVVVLLYMISVINDTEVSLMMIFVPFFIYIILFNNELYDCCCPKDPLHDAWWWAASLGRCRFLLVCYFIYGRPTIGKRQTCVTTALFVFSLLLC